MQYFFFQNYCTGTNLCYTYKLCQHIYKNVSEKTMPTHSKINNNNNNKLSMSGFIHKRLSI